MIQKKVCLLGAAAVGKTSMVARFVHNMFSEKYHSSIGVKVDKKTVVVAAQEVTLLLWDLYGEDEFQKLRPSYLRGASGYLLVVDGTRRSTMETALDLRSRVEQAIGAMPVVLVLNKSDLAEAWDLPDDVEKQLAAEGWTVIRSSAKSGAGVEAAFAALAGKLIGE